jgi:hypothetical protein
MHAHTWRVAYHDGTIINESDGHTWDEVDIAKLHYIYIMDWIGFIGLSVAVVPEHPPEFFRRESDGVTCVGWPGAYVWILDNGVIALTAGKEAKV